MKLVTALKASNILYVQCCSIIVPAKGVELTNKSFLAKLYQYLRNFNEISWHLRLSNALKLSSKQTTKENAFIIDLLHTSALYGHYVTTNQQT